MDKTTLKIMLQSASDIYTVQGWAPAVVAHMAAEALRYINELEAEKAPPVSEPQQLVLG